MKFNKIILTVLTLINTVTAWAFINDVIVGNEVVYLKDVSSYALNGERDNNIEHKKICLQKFSWITNSEPLDINYKINTKTGSQSATVHLINTLVSLSPMGILGSYSFLTQKGIPEDLKILNIRQIYFKLNMKFELKKVAVSFLDRSLDFQCIAESDY